MSLEINEFFVEENKKFEVKMNRNEFQALNALGDKLFSFTTRLPDEETNDEEVDAMFKIDIQMSPHQEDTYFVEVKNAIGQIVLADKVFNISPKIGDDHFFEIYNFNKNKYKDLGILDNQGSATKGSILFLILNDFLNGVETVVNKGIRKGYKQFEDELKFIKGRVNVISTTRNLLTGKIAIQTEYEEFSIDTAMNRLIKSALFEIKTLQYSKNIENILLNYEEIVNKANKLYRHFEFIPDYKQGDLRVQIDRNTKYYEQALVGAKNILQSIGASVKVGDVTASARLMKTYNVIEDGIRYFLNQNLPDRFMCNSKATYEYTLKRNRLVPDLVFGSPYIATGDIKYKIWSADSKKSQQDRYQSIYFAEGYQVTKAIVIVFSDSSFNGEKQYDKIGDIDYFVSSWNVDLEPSKSSNLLLTQIIKCLEK